VETMCTAHGSFVDQSHDRIPVRRGLCGNLLHSGLIQLAWLYITHSQVLIQAYSSRLSAPVSKPTCTWVSVALHGLLPMHTANKLCRALGGDSVHRQVSWLVLAKKGRRESATIATVGVRDNDEAKSRSQTIETAEKHQVNRGSSQRI